MASKHTFEDSAVAQELKVWGRGEARYLKSTGFSSQSTLARLFEGWSGHFGHKVLIQDAHEQYWKINARVKTLPDHLIDTLRVRYALPPRTNEDGSIEYWKRNELAEILGISESQYRKQLKDAKNRYRRLLFDQPLSSHV